MPADLLAPYRRSGAPPLANVSPPEFTGYRAYGVAEGGTRPLRLDVRPKDGLAVARPYTALNEIAYDRPGYSGILLVYATKWVKLRGRHLRAVVEALLAGTCEYVAELGDSETAPPGAPVIERIEVMGLAAPPPGREGER